MFVDLSVSVSFSEYEGSMIVVDEAAVLPVSFV